MHFDRDTIASAIVGSGGAWRFGAALRHAQSGQFGGTQLAELFYAGVGFLTSAAAARWLQHTGNRRTAAQAVCGGVNSHADVSRGIAGWD